MKKLSFLSAFIMLFAAIGFTSCDSEPVDPLLIDGGQQTGPAVFKVDFNGNTYVADQATATVNAGLISVSGIKLPGGESVTLMVPGTTTGTYDLADGGSLSYHPSLTATYFYTNVDPSSEEDPNGTVTITSINTANHTISGTFSFVGYRNDVEEDTPSITFNNGSFQNIPYTGTIGPQPEASFKVNIDGTLFTADDAVATMGEGLTNIVGFRGANGEYVGIVINATASGTYTDEAIMSYAASEDDENVYGNLFDESARTVTIQINTTNHTISGTFSFTGVNEAGDDKVFTSGVFENIPYTEDSTPEDDALTATINGTFIDYENSIITSYVDGGSGANIGIQGIGANGTGIRLSIPENLGVGIYPITGITSPIRAYYSVDEDNELIAAEGSVTIVSQGDDYITGIFQYVIKNDAGEVIHEVTGGEFDVAF